MRTKPLAAALALILVTACAAPPPRREPAPPALPPAAAPTPGETRLLAPGPLVEAPAAPVVFRLAEKLYADGRHAEAAERYRQFITESGPIHPLVPNAYFNIGLCWFQAGRYRDAALYFAMVAERYPRSDLAAQALLNTGVSKLQGDEFDAAQEFFSRALGTAAQPNIRAYGYYYLATLEERKARYLPASENYAQAERQAADAPLAQAARARLTRIFHNFLGEADLLSAAARFAGQAPAAIALTELELIYTRSGDQEKLARVRAERARQFPQTASAVPAAANDDAYEPVRPAIGAALPLTGPNAQAGREALQGIQLAFNSFTALTNERGIQLIVRDTGAMDPREAVAGLASEKDTLLILGPLFSDEFKNSTAAAQTQRIPVVSPTATAEGATGDSGFLFRVALTASQEAGQLAALAVNTLKLRSFVIIHPDAPYGAALARHFSEAVTRMGAAVMAMEQYEQTQTDFGGQIRAIGGMRDGELRDLVKQIIAESRKQGESPTPERVSRILAQRHAGKFTTPVILEHSNEPLRGDNYRPGLALKFDAVFLPGMYDQVGLILPELEFYNIRNVAKLATRGVNHPQFLRLAERFAEGVILADGFFQGSAAPHVKTFVRDYQLAFQQDPTIIAAQSYDVARIALSAISRGAASRRQVVEYLQHLNGFQGVTGSTTIKSNGDADKTMFYLTVQNGQFQELAIEQENAPAAQPQPQTISPE
ncbi:MAG: ABC transporter substrate-binding protein [Nitrospinae bacterium]|nr:ABC transporter substrate-binding protein [Nitrospinota bacterium]